jgi:thiamine-monophosphate kinase
MFENPQKTELSQLGEFGLIDHITKNINLYHRNTIKGVGDDAAVIKNGNIYTIVTTDMLTEGVHFDLIYTPLKHLGYKAITSNLSDICAMNATPKQVTVSLALSSKFTLEAVEELYSGILLACDKYKVDLIGGDTTSSKMGLTISVTAIGETTEDKIAYRNTAKEKDLLVVSGDLGGAYTGLQVLEREKRIFLENPQVQPDLEGYDYILERQLKPEARVDVVEYLHEIGVVPTSMIDISDGLASEINHICRQSNVGCDLYEEKIPIDPQTYETARSFNLDPTVCALHGGEDYELLFTIKMSDYEKIKGSPLLTVIGHITDKSQGVRLIDKSGGVHNIESKGWNAFSKNN